jgi:hypothetical protein
VYRYIVRIVIVNAFVQQKLKIKIYQKKKKIKIAYIIINISNLLSFKYRTIE